MTNPSALESRVLLSCLATNRTAQQILFGHNRSSAVLGEDYFMLLASLESGRCCMFGSVNSVCGTRFP